MEWNVSDVFPCENTVQNYWTGLALSKIAGKTYKWYPSDHPSTYRNTPEQLYGPDDITYVMNDHGYRCDPFDDKNPSILFIGCSNTLGVGLPYEETYPYHFVRLVEKQLGSRVNIWNLAHGGKGIDYIVRTLFLTRGVLSPDFAIVVAPPATRMEIFDRKNDSFLHDVVNPFANTETISSRERHGILRMTSSSEQAMRTARMAAMLETILTCPYRWNSWGLCPKISQKYYPLTAGRFENTRFKSQFSFDKKARDHAHPGPVSSLSFANSLFDEFGGDVLSSIKKRW